MIESAGPLVLLGTHLAAFGTGGAIARWVTIRRLRVCEAKDGHPALEVRHPGDPND